MRFVAVHAQKLVRRQHVSPYTSNVSGSTSCFIVKKCIVVGEVSFMSKNAPTMQRLNDNDKLNNNCSGRNQLVKAGCEPGASVVTPTTPLDRPPLPCGSVTPRSLVLGKDVGALLSLASQEALIGQCGRLRQWWRSQRYNEQKKDMRLFFFS